jgi:hypothetical protein
VREWRWPDEQAAQVAGATDAAYTLPSLLDRTPPTAQGWKRRRRALLDAFAESTYGYTPDGGSLAGLTLQSRQGGGGAPFGLRSEWVMTLRGTRGTLDVPLTIFEPAQPAAPAGSPVFLGMNISGNHAVGTVPGVRLDGWMPIAWPLRAVLERGFAVATVFNDSVEADEPGAAWCGVRGLFEADDDLISQGPAQWGALGAWAWALSRARDAIDSIPGLDGDRVIVHGHSRLGKTALWAAAQDERFAGAISNESGLGGASLTRHAEGEDAPSAARRFPHWFCGNYAASAARGDDLPVDQHQLLALVAPRPLHVSSADRDQHADPEGEFLATLHASPVYELLGHCAMLPSNLPRKGFDLSAEEAASVPRPIVDRRNGGRLSYHVRRGRHGVTELDWSLFLDFAEANGI